MKKIVKQVVGIDVAQKELIVCLGRMYDNWEPELYSYKEFANTKKGFENLGWMGEKSKQTKLLQFGM